MSTFKASRSETGYMKIEQRIADTQIYVELKNGNFTVSSIFDPANAPAIALAVLEAAGMAELNSGASKAADHAYDAAASLRSAIHFAAAAAEEAELEQEALELWRTFSEQAGTQLHTSWGDLDDDDDSAAWIATARRARELAEERNK